MTGRRWLWWPLLAAVLSLALSKPAQPASPAGRTGPEVPRPAPAKCAPRIFAPVGLPAAKADSTSPRTDDRGLDVLSYDLELVIDPGTKMLQGRVAVGLAPLRSGLDRVVLDLVAGLECLSVEFRWGPASFVHLGDSLVVSLPAPLETAVPETLTVSYAGRPLPHGPFDAGFLWRFHDNGTPNDPADDVPAIATVVEPSSAHSWWPCKDHPGDKALVSLAVTVPDSLAVVANGFLEGVTNPAPGLRRFQWRESYPIATYLVSIALSDYASWTENCAGLAGPQVSLEFHVFPQDRLRAEHDLEPTCRMLELMTELAGPYPFAGEKYAQAEIKWVGAMENQTATSISQFFLTGDGRNETIVIHELAHQWFGDSLTPLGWQDIWLNEGFARYAECLWIEREYGEPAYRRFMLDIGVHRHPTLFAGEGTLADPSPILPNLLVYNKGAWVLHLLRMLVGDGAFFTFLRDYAGDPELVFGSVDTERMIAAAELAAGRSLQAFFTPLLETDAVPRIETTVALEPDTDRAVLTLRQLQTPIFEMPVPVRLVTACGRQDRLVVLDQVSRTFILQAACRIDSVLVDPDTMSLILTYPGQPAPMTVLGPAPNPAGSAGTRFEIFLTRETQVTVKSYDAKGRAVSESDLGLLAATGAQGDPATSPHAFAWPPAGGRGPASGVYWLSFQSPGREIVRKVTLVR